MKKRIVSILSLIPILYLVVYSGTMAHGKTQFTDVNSTHWAYSAIQWADENGVVNGYPDGTFLPNKVVTEAEFLKMFIQTYRQLEEKTSTNHWADPVYAIAKENNLPVKGYSDYSYRGQAINRQAVAEIIAGANGSAKLGSEAIQFLLDKGYSQGKTANSVEGYRGQDSLTRAEAVQFIRNVKEKGMQDIQPRPMTPDGENKDKNSIGGQTVDYATELFSTDGMFPLTDAEKELAQLINKYRQEQGLATFKLSKSLTKVARYHVYDSLEHLSLDEKCNLHSWSNQGFWTGGCYTADHNNASLMWSKPDEITNGEYTGYGYEISYWHSAQVTPKGALEAWQKSKGHHDVIIGNGSWSDLNVMGIAIQGNYAHVWFGKEEDPNGYFAY